VESFPRNQKRKVFGPPQACLDKIDKILDKIDKIKDINRDTRSLTL
jgi:hypothetical protein